MLIGKKFDVNGSILEVLKEDSDFAYLSGGAAIKKTTLLSSYDEYMDPSTFFNTSQNALGNLANQLKENVQQTNTSTYVDERTHVSVNDPNLGIQSQPAAQQVETIMGNSNPSMTSNPVYQQAPVNHYTTPSNSPEDALFRKMKKPDSIDVVLSFKEKIPARDFIRLMNDNFETSIIDYLAKDFTDKLLMNPELLEIQIKTFLNKLIYPERFEEKEILSNIDKELIVKTDKGVDITATTINILNAELNKDKKDEPGVIDYNDLIDPEDLALMNTGNIIVKTEVTTEIIDDSKEDINT